MPSGLIAKVSGSGPEGSVRSSFIVFGSKAWIESSSEAQTNSSEPSGLMMMPRGRRPTSTVLVTFHESRSITLTVLSFSFVT